MKPLRWLAVALMAVFSSACGVPPTPIPFYTLTPAVTAVPTPTVGSAATAAPSATTVPPATAIPTKAGPTTVPTQAPKATSAPAEPTRVSPSPTPVRSLEAEWSVQNLLVAPGQPGRLYAFLRRQVQTVTAADMRLLVSDDGGNLWEAFAGGLPTCPKNSPIVGVNLDYATKDSLYVSGCDGLYHWTGSQWQKISSQFTKQVAVLYGQPNVIWALAGNTTDPIIRSDDGGRTWKPASTGLVHFSGMASIGFDPRDNKTLYGIIMPKYAGSYLRRGKSDGTWETMPTPNDATIETGMAIDGATGALYVTAFDGTRNVWQLWRSPNPNVADVKSVTWQPVYDFGRETGRVVLLASGSSAQGLAIYAQVPPSSCDLTAANPCLWRVMRSNDSGRNWSGVVIK